MADQRITDGNVFGPGLPDEKEKSRHSTKLITLPGTIATFAATFFCVWAIDSLRLRIALPACIVVVACALFVAIWFAGKSLRKG